MVPWFGLMCESVVFPLIMHTCFFLFSSDQALSWAFEHCLERCIHVTSFSPLLLSIVMFRRT